MAFEIKAYPEWSWSQSRDHVFQECKRKYYYQYYGSHNGWLVDAPAAAKAAYRFKQMTNLYLILGDAIHQVAQAGLTEWQQEKAIRSKEDMVMLVRGHLNQAFKDSKQLERWLDYPKKTMMLHEMYYGGALPLKKVDQIKSRMHACIDHFYTSPTYQELLHDDSIQVAEVEQLNTIFLLDDKVYVKLDLLYTRADGTWVIVDWKTGKDSETIEQQMLVYALYLKEQYKVPLEKMELRIEYLVPGESVKVEATEEGIRSTKQWMVGSIEEMKLYVEDDQLNKPLDASAFPAEPSAFKCGSCNFFEICQRGA
jgi:CRISPR/Cas system-associated exonuclease Cas4 (RecB family)